MAKVTTKKDCFKITSLW